jgi:hypothetical protein
MRIFLALLVVLWGSAAGAQITVKPTTKDSAMQYRVAFTTNHAINTITDAIPACFNVQVYFEQGTASVVSLYAVDDTDDTVSEVEASTLVNQFTGTSKVTAFSPTKSYLRFVVDTAETSGESFAVVHCSNTASLDGGGGDSGGGVLDDLITTIDCVANVATIPATTGIYRLEAASACVEDDAIAISAIGAVVDDNSIQLTVINDTGDRMLLDASANTAVIEGGSNTVPAGATFSVVQTDTDAVHVIGTGSGIVNLIAGIDAIDDVPDPRDTDEDGTFASAVPCSGTCRFQSSTGNFWTYNATMADWWCDTCRRITPATWNVTVTGSGCAACDDTACLAGGTRSEERINIDNTTSCSGASGASHIVPTTGGTGPTAYGDDMTIEKLCFKNSSLITALDGIQFQVGDDISGASLAGIVATVNIPNSTGGSHGSQLVTCSADTPALMSSTAYGVEANDGDFCQTGPDTGCVLDAAASGELLIEFMEL